MENDKIPGNTAGDSSMNKYDELFKKFQAIAQKSKESGLVWTSFGEWEPQPHPAEKLTKYLAQAAAFIWKSDRITQEWRTDYKSLIHAIGITVKIKNTTASFLMKFTEEYFHTDGANEKANFFDMLERMCKTLDSKIPMAYPLMPKRGALTLTADDSMPIAATFSQTTSSYEYLKHCGYLAQLDWYWDHPEIPFPQRLAYEGGFYAETDFWIKDIPEGTMVLEWMNKKLPPFQAGGFIDTGGEYEDSGDLLRMICPGLKAKVKMPCNCSSIEPVIFTVEKTIVHLNDSKDHAGDSKEWTREEIADWLESLDVDLSIKDNSANTEKEK